MAGRPSPEAGGSYRSPAFEHARVSDAMRPGVISCPPNTSVASVAQVMAQQHIHSVVVTDLEDDDWGVVSDVDVLRAAGQDLDERTADEIAGTELPTLSPDESLERAAQVMAEHEVTHVMVVSRAGAPLGILSSLDVAGVIAWGRA